MGCLAVLTTLIGGTATARPKDWQTDLRPAIQAMGASDYEKARAGFARYAARNPLAQFNLGLLAQNGWGMPANPRKACDWFEKAAHGKVPAAQHFYGVCLVAGIGRPSDVPAAIGWFKEAASRGHLLSLCTAGELYIRGQGVPKDVEQGIALCTQAARQEVPLAILTLADFYREGQDVPPNPAAARYWYAQAAEHHRAEAQYRLAAMLAAGEGGEPNLNAALFWMETAASEGFAPAYLQTAILYANASPQPETGALAPEHLAKIYLWLGAAKKTSNNASELEEIGRIEKMVLEVMPASWRGKLDKQVDAHLSAFSRQ